MVSTGGDHRAITWEVDPALASRARQALAHAGHHPQVICGDGAAGLAQAAPYNRVISTVALPATPKIRSNLLESVRPSTMPSEALSDAHPAAFYLSLRCPWPYKVIQFIPDDAA